MKAGLVETVENWVFSSGKYYLKGASDCLVDGYVDMSKVEALKIEQDVEGEDFEKGNLIGSTFFRFQFFDEAEDRD